MNLEYKFVDLIILCIISYIQSTMLENRFTNGNIDNDANLYNENSIADESRCIRSFVTTYNNENSTLASYSIDWEYYSYHAIDFIFFSFFHDDGNGLWVHRTYAQEIINWGMNWERNALDSNIYQEPIEYNPIQYEQNDEDSYLHQNFNELSGQNDFHPQNTYEYQKFPPLNSDRSTRYHQYLSKASIAKYYESFLLAKIIYSNSTRVFNLIFNYIEFVIENNMDSRLMNFKSIQYYLLENFTQEEIATLIFNEDMCFKRNHVKISRNGIKEYKECVFMPYVLFYFCFLDAHSLFYKFVFNDSKPDLISVAETCVTFQFSFCKYLRNLKTEEMFEDFKKIKNSEIKAIVLSSTYFDWEKLNNFGSKFEELKYFVSFLRDEDHETIMKSFSLKNGSYEIIPREKECWFYVNSGKISSTPIRNVNRDSIVNDNPDAFFIERTPESYQMKLYCFLAIEIYLTIYLIKGDSDFEIMKKSILSRLEKFFCLQPYLLLHRAFTLTLKYICGAFSSKLLQKEIKLFYKFLQICLDKVKSLEELALFYPIKCYEICEICDAAIISIKSFDYDLQCNSKTIEAKGYKAFFSNYQKKMKKTDYFNKFKKILVKFSKLINYKTNN